MLEVKDRTHVLLGARKQKTAPISVTLTQEAKEMIEEIASERTGSPALPQ